jgi:hypothetical protein
MSNALSPELLAQIFAQESNDPFLVLVTLSHPDITTLRFVNNSEPIVSRGDTFLAFPMMIKLPTDDGETQREVAIEFDNVSLELIEPIRSIDSDEKIAVKLEMVLASLPDAVQMSLEELFIKSVQYNKQRVSASIGLDDFMNTQLTSEQYNPSNFPGIF